MTFTDTLYVMTRNVVSEKTIRNDLALFSPTSIATDQGTCLGI